MKSKFYRVIESMGNRAILVKELKILGISFAVGLLLAVSFAAYTYVYSQTTQQNIAENVIRFHVRANSDSIIDQELKEHVRIEVLSEFEKFLSASADIYETRTVLKEKLGYIQSHAENVVRAAGFKHPVTTEMSTMFFPTQFYGSIAFPPGEYEAVKIIIGEGEGSNWWCLMFPPLCYVDMTATDAGRRQLADTVSDESFRLLTHQEEQSSSLRVRFRVVEWWQNRGQPQSSPVRDIAGR